MYYYHNDSTLYKNMVIQPHPPLLSFIAPQLELRDPVISFIYLTSLLFYPFYYYLQFVYIYL